MLKKIHPGLFALGFALTLCTNVHTETATQEIPKTNLEKISDINMKSFPWNEEGWSSWSFEEFLTKSLHHRLNPTEREKRSRAFNVFIEEEKKQLEPKKNVEHTEANNIFNDTVTWEDLNLFCGKNNPTKFVANIINRSITEYGTIASYLLLADPTDNIVALKNRQNIIRFFIDNPDVIGTLTELLNIIKESENCVLGFWAKQDDYAVNVNRELVYTDFLAPLNSSEAMLTARSILQHEKRISSLVFASVSAAVLLSYGFLHLTNIIDVPSSLKKWAKKYQQQDFIFSLLNSLPNRHIQGVIALLSGAYFCQETYHTYNWVNANFLLEKNLHIVMQAIAKTMDAVEKIHQLINQHRVLQNFEEFSPLKTFFEEDPKTSKDLEDFFYNLGDETLLAQPSLLSSKGVIVQTYTLIEKIKQSLSCALATVGRIDAYLGLARLYKEYEHKSHRYSFVNYLENTKTPVIKLVDFWHPLVNEEKVVTNTLKLGDAHPNNIIITGPNEGGKSTSLKTIALCLVMGQTIGLAPTRSCSFTPFASLATYLNITDDIGAGNSLFKAEVLRTQELLEKLNKLPSEKFSFTIFDEVFNGTTPVEGELAAYGVANYLSRYQNNICIIATHFHMLTTLETATESYKNYKVSVALNQDGSITYPHKLEAGISDQNIAFAILRNQGFDAEILKTQNR